MPDEKKAVARVPATPLTELGGAVTQDFRNGLEAFKPQFDAALAGRMKVEHFIEVATTAFLTTPKLRECSPLSVMRAFLKAAQMKLRPDGEEAAIIPYKGEAEFQPMFKGIVRTLLRTKTVRKVESHAVRTGDFFEFEYGLNPKLRHTPGPSQQRGETTHVYAIAWLSSGERQFEVMDRAELDAIQKEAERQRRGNSTPAWDNHPDEMRRKIVVKRLAKYLEMDPEQAAVIEYDNALEAGRSLDPGDLNPEWELRTLDQRVRDHAARQTAELQEAMARMAEPAPPVPSMLGRLVGFGRYRDKTWGEVLEKQRGYVTHFAITPACTGLSEAEKVELAALAGPSEHGPEQPDPEAMAALRARGSGALVALRKAKRITDEQMADLGSELGLLEHEGDAHGLADAVDELERRASATVPADLFGGGDGR